MDKTYIDNDCKIFTGKEAESRLSFDNDTPYLSYKGVTAVPEKRWNRAQNFEFKTWMILNPNSKDDRNMAHKRAFNDYECLKNENLPRVIELGCGPFTNLRVFPDLGFTKIDLLDPLINTYLSHRNCTYANKALFNKPVTLHEMPVESFRVEEPYDLVIIINVLSHCMDANKALEVTYNAVRKGGYIVFHECSSRIENIPNFYDAGHPIRLSESYLREFMSQFRTVYITETPMIGDDINKTCFYFIGQK